MIGIHGTDKNHRIAPVRSSSALILSSVNLNRQRLLYPTAANLNARLQQSGVQYALPAYCTNDRNKNLH